MANKSFTPILGKRIRATELDNCGNVVPGPEGNNIVTNGFITATLTAEIEDGAEILVRRADGGICVNERSSDSFKYFTVEMEFCGVNPSLLALTTNAEVYEAEEDVIGFTVPEGAIEKWFALEMWTGLSGQACAPGQEEASGYMLLPFVVGGVLGDITVDSENAVTFSLTGARTKGGNAWGVGPFDVVQDAGDLAAPLPTAVDAMDHLLLIETGLTVPAHSTEPIPNPVIGV